MTFPSARLYCLSLNFRLAAIERREVFALSESALAGLLRALVDGGLALEAIVLSTCHRFELYCIAAPGTTPDAIRDQLLEEVGLAHGKTPNFTVIADLDAVRRLFRIASGLESLVLGENQVLSQMKDAYRIACDAETSGFHLNACFHRAFRVGKAVRSQTRLSAGGSSVGTVAVDMAARDGRVADKRVLVVGAGEIGALCLRAAVARKPATLTLVNRTTRRGPARDLAAKHNARFAPLEALAGELLRHDAVFTATASPDAVITLAMLRGADGLAVYDLALPRDVEEGADRLPGVFYYTVDDIQPHADRLAIERADAIPAAEALVNAALADFDAWLLELSAVPSIRRILELGGALQAEEDAFLAERLSGDALDAARHSVRRLSQNLMRTIIDELKRTVRNTRRRTGGA
ncbi:MAG: glutamyl-tRNA reductase [Planctomycetota bacterium]|jgi:glutamyl-tRNA reductase|nr:glutamyl-tRNA reductase [Planctomycetota bacterium]